MRYHSHNPRALQPFSHSMNRIRTRRIVKRRFPNASSIRRLHCNRQLSTNLHRIMNAPHLMFIRPRLGTRQFSSRRILPETADTATTSSVPDPASQGGANLSQLNKSSHPSDEPNESPHAPSALGPYSSTTVAGSPTTTVTTKQ